MYIYIYLYLYLYLFIYIYIYIGLNRGRYPVGVSIASSIPTLPFAWPPAGPFVPPVPTLHARRLHPPAIYIYIHTHSYFLLAAYDSDSSLSAYPPAGPFVPPVPPLHARRLGPPARARLGRQQRSRQHRPRRKHHQVPRRYPRADPLRYSNQGPRRYYLQYPLRYCLRCPRRYFRRCPRLCFGCPRRYRAGGALFEGRLSDPSRAARVEGGGAHGILHSAGPKLRGSCEILPKGAAALLPSFGDAGGGRAGRAHTRLVQQVHRLAKPRDGLFHAPAQPAAGIGRPRVAHGRDQRLVAPPNIPLYLLLYLRLIRVNPNP